MQWNCQMCGYQTTLKCDLKKHLSRKKKCVKTNNDCVKTHEELLQDLIASGEANKTHNCVCGKKYTHLSGLSRHHKECEKYRLSILEKRVEKIETDMKNGHTNHNGDIHGDQNMNAESSNHCNNHNNNNNTTTIVINNFGSEDISYLSPEFIEKCTCVLSLGVQSLAKAIHLNKDHPENHTMKVTNVKSPHVQVMMNKKWIYKDKKDALKILIEKISDIQRNYVEDHRDGIKERWNSYKLDAIEFFHERLENDDKKLWRHLMKEIYLMFCNHKDLFPRTTKA